MDQFFFLNQIPCVIEMKKKINAADPFIHAGFFPSDELVQRSQ
jgi:hypothetical protein